MDVSPSRILESSENPISAGPLTDQAAIAANKKESVSGGYNVQPVGTQTSPEVQEAWNEQMAIITEIINKLNMSPPQVDPSDLDDLVDALKALETLAKEGITNESGQTYYITKEMAQALTAMNYQFAKLGITAELNTTGMSDTAKVNLLTKASNPTADPTEDPLQAAVKNAASYTYEDLGFQTYMYVMIMGIINTTGAEFQQLEEYLNQSNDILTELNDLVEISSYTNPPEVWEADMNLDDPGDIPPTAVAEIQTYIEDNGGNSDEIKFAETYQAEYDAAKARSEANGTTIEEEMHNAEQYPPYVDANGNRNDVQSSADILGHFVGYEKEPNRVIDIGKIMLDSVVTELSNVPTAPDGMTMEEVGQEIWQTKEALEAQIAAMPADADPALVDSLQDIVDSIDKLWTDALSANGLPTTLTPEEAIAQGHGDVVEDFAISYINYTQPGQQGATELDTGVQRFQAWNEELQKEFQKLMTMLENLVKLLGQLLKMTNDIASSYIKNYAS